MRKPVPRDAPSAWSVGVAHRPSATLWHPLRTVGGMGTKNRERRAAKAKRRAREAGRRSGGGAWHERRTDPPYERLFTRGEQARGLLELGAAAMERGDDEFVNDAISMLASAEVALVDRESEAALLAIVSLLWTHGWQPAELVRHARRADARFGRLVAVAVAADHAGRDARTLHPAWAAQVESLGLPAVARSTGWLAGFTRREELARRSLVATVVGVLRVLYGVGPLPPVLPPPGDITASCRLDASAVVDDPVLARVRALLAQAESTTFEAEAEAFTAKAQELMARHAIDAAVLWARSERDERPTMIRVAIDDPYADIKSLLLQHIAHHSRCRAVFHRPLRPLRGRRFRVRRRRGRDAVHVPAGAVAGCVAGRGSQGRAG